MKAAAQAIRDNDQTRQEIEAALRSVAARKIFSTSFAYARTLRSYAVIADERRDLGALDIFQVPGLVDALADLMVDVLVGT